MKRIDALILEGWQHYLETDFTKYTQKETNNKNNILIRKTDSTDIFSTAAA